MLNKRKKFKLDHKKDNLPEIFGLTDKIIDRNSSFLEEVYNKFDTKSEVIEAVWNSKLSDKELALALVVMGMREQDQNHKIEKMKAINRVISEMSGLFGDKEYTI